MKLKKEFIKALEIFSSSNNIIITTHTNPDADAIGSCMALYCYSKSKGKNVKIINCSETPDNLKFLDSDNNIIKYSEQNYEEIKNADCIFILDLNDTKRLKDMENAVLNSSAKKIMIDHHLFPMDFCNVYCTYTEASSTGELIWDFLNTAQNFKLTKEISINLYAAIMTDTGSFRFPRTTAKVHQIIAKLIKFGAEPYEIYDKIYNSYSISANKLLGIAMSNMNTYFDGQVCIMKISKEDILKVGAKDEDIDNFVEKTLTIKGVVLGILASEITNKDEIRVSIRSKGNISARNLAMEFNGGGHYNAAGARIFNKNIDDAVNEILEIINKNYDNIFIN